MHIVVCVKAVPGSTEVKMDPKTNTIVRDGGQAVINPFDASALETALRIKDAAAEPADVRVSVLSMGIPATADLLRDCIARGADDGLLLSDRAFAGADTLATTYALSRGIEALGGADLILCGKMAVDGDTAQIGPELAGTFEWPCATDVVEVRGLEPMCACVRANTDRGVAGRAASRRADGVQGHRRSAYAQHRRHHGGGGGLDRGSRREALRVGRAPHWFERVSHAGGEVVCSRSRRRRRDRSGRCGRAGMRLGPAD